MATIIGNQNLPLQGQQRPLTLADKIAESLARNNNGSQLALGNAQPLELPAGSQQDPAALPPGFVLQPLQPQQQQQDQQPAQFGAALPPGFVLQPQVSPEKPSDDGFFERTAESLRKRGATLADIFSATAGKEQTIEEAIFQTVGTQIGALGDVIGQGVVTAAKELPDAIKDPIVAGVNDLLATEMGKNAIKALSKGAESWDKFKNESPRAARNIDAMFNVGTFFTPIKGVSAAALTGKGITQTKKGLQKLTTKAPVITSDDITMLARQAYARADSLGGILKPQFINRFIDKIQEIAPQTEIGKLMSGDSPFTKAAAKISELRDTPITLKGAQEFDESLGDIIDSLMDAGRLTKEGRKILQIQTSFRDIIEKSTLDMIEGGRAGFEALKDGRRLWAASRRLDDIERIIQRAELIDNPATSIKTGFRTLLSNPKRIRGFSKKEVALMRKAAKTGIISDTFRVILGSRLIPIITSATGGGFGAVTMATAGSIAARGVASKAAVGRAAAVTKEIAKRAAK